MDAVLTLENGDRIDSVVSDLSLEGCCVTGTLPIGATVELKMARIGTQRGQVRWSFGGRSGVRFLSREAA